jgi:hypothetical protein
VNAIGQLPQISTRAHPRRAATHRLALAALLAVAVTAAQGAPAQGAQPEERAGAAAPELPLGHPGLSESRTSMRPAPGVRYTRIERGEVSRRDVYTVDVAFRARRDDARALAARLREDGHRPRIVRVAQRAPDDPQRGPLGYLVRVGALHSEQEANALRDRLAADGYTGLRVVYTGEDGGRTTGPWVVHVLEVQPDALAGALDARLATDVVPERELLTSIAGRTDAVASLNGGYFVIGPADGTPGDLAGISMLDGRLVSEAVNGRTSLVLPDPTGAGARVAALSSRQTAMSSDGALREVDGLNRKPGLIRGCGGVGGDSPTELPKHDFTCTDPTELIQFTPDFGTATEPGEGAEAALDADGRVTELRPARGGAIPPGGSVLSGTGEGADWLRAHARPGARVDVATGVRAGGGTLAPSPTLDVINGGPRLLRDGRPAITATAEGFHWKENPEFYYRFGVRRNPRTLAGVGQAGTLVLVAVDGRRPGHSVGASFEESAAVLRALGAADGVNLDGGGSTGMTLGPRLVTRPSDTTGERPIADALVLEGG